ncbi:MAG: SlyX protein [Paraglaciecola sp.]|jgi:SlyX protein
MQQIEADIEQLQMKVSFQEDTIEELNSALIQQQKQLEVLQFTISHLVNKVNTLQTPNSGNEDNEPPPPHY